MFISLEIEILPIFSDFILPLTITKSHENYHYTIIFVEIDKNLIMYLIVILSLIKKLKGKLFSCKAFVISRVCSLFFLGSLNVSINILVKLQCREADV